MTALAHTVEFLPLARIHLELPLKSPVKQADVAFIEAPLYDLQNEKIHLFPDISPLPNSLSCASLCLFLSLICIRCLTQSVIYNDSPISLWHTGEMLYAVTKDNERHSKHSSRGG